MTLNRWWVHDPAERYWMEITSRSDLGDDLYAPKLDDRGQPYWGYNLVTEVCQGDIVLHWHSTLMGEPGIVGWSRAVGTPIDTTIVWRSRRSQGAAIEEPAWRMGLEDYTPLLAPLGLADVRKKEPALRAATSRLRQSRRGALYLPFAFSDKRPIRAAQGYLVKFPRAYISSLGLFDIIPWADEVGRPPGRRPAQPPRKDGRGGYVSDPRVRRAIERHAVNQAIAHYERLGYTVEDVGAFESFDLLITDPNGQQRVEVKGSSGVADSVELTIGEVKNASEGVITNLFIVEQIAWWRESDGSVRTDGGRQRVFSSWVPDQGDLEPTRYRYRVPKGP